MHNTAQQIAKAQQLLQQQQFKQASKLLQKIVKHDKRHSGAHHLLGMALLAQQQLPAAEKALKACLAIDGNNLQARLDLAGLCGQLGKHQDGLKHYDALLQAKPGHPQIMLGKAALLVSAKQFDTAIALLEHLISDQPQWWEPYRALITLLSRKALFDEALDVSTRALQAGIKEVNAYLEHAKYLSYQGKKQDAIESINTALQIHPNNLTLMLELATLDYRLVEGHIATKITQIDPQQLPPAERFPFFALQAQQYRLQGDLDAEMHAWVQAHGYFLQTKTFAADNHFYFEQLAKPQALKHIQHDAASPTHDYRPVFIVGVPRSGSTLIENILCAGPEPLLKGEETGVFCSALFATLQGEAKQKSLNALVCEMYEDVRLMASDCKRFTDKSLENIFIVNHLLQVFPDAKVIVCQRHPRTSLVSILRNVLTELPWAHTMETILQYLDLSYQAAEHWLATYPENVMRVEYEALVASPEAESQRVFEFCGLPWDASCLEFHKDAGVSRTSSNLQIREGINQKGVNAFEELDAFFAPYVAQYPWLANKKD